MPRFGPTSLAALDSIHVDLRKVLLDAIEVMDFTIIEGHRGKAAQEAAFKSGASKAQFGESLHNSWPSLACDIAPWPVDWKNIQAFFFLAGVMFGCAKKHGVKLRWGHDWDMDMDFKDQRFNDMPHFELVLEEPKVTSA